MAGRIRQFSSFAFIICVVALIVAITFCGCTTNTSTTANQSMPVSSAEKFKVNQAAVDEVARLASLTAQNKTTVDDFAAIENMTSGDDAATDELTEITTMVKYGEFEHASHGLSFLESYFETGKKLICPGHSLSHFYIFTKHNETQLAADNLAEAKENLDAWIPKAQNFTEQYPGPVSFDVILTHIQTDIKNIDAGNRTASNEEVDFLSNEASICVEADN